MKFTHDQKYETFNLSLVKIFIIFKEDRYSSKIKCRIMLSQFIMFVMYGSKSLNKR